MGLNAMELTADGTQILSQHLLMLQDELCEAGYMMSIQKQADRKINLVLLKFFAKSKPKRYHSMYFLYKENVDIIQVGLSLTKPPRIGQEEPTLSGTCSETGSV